MHVAIIMDGNRRWATENGLPKIVGHTHGAKNIEEIAVKASNLGIKYLTLYALSTENVANRSAEELKHLFSLFEKLVDYKSLFKDNDIAFKAIGNISALPESVRDAFLVLERDTQDGSKMVLTICVNYGGRDEIIRSAQRVIDAGGTLSEESVSQALDFPELPDADLVIRTGGHRRLSNFLIWQATYAELYFTDIKWPAFNGEELQKALDWFSEQKRNQGK